MKKLSTYITESLNEKAKEMKNLKKVKVGDTAVDYSDHKWEVLAKETDRKKMLEIAEDESWDMDEEDLKDYEGLIQCKHKKFGTVWYVYGYDGAVVMNESLNEAKKINIKVGDCFEVIDELDVDIDSDSPDWEGVKGMNAMGNRIKVTKVKNDWIRAELYNDEGEDSDASVEFGLDDMGPLKKIKSVHQR